MNMDLTTREHLLHFMQRLALSVYDSRFIQNMLNLLAQHKPLTSNQVALVEKMIVKYKRQLATNWLITSDIVETLIWTTPIVTSDPLLTGAFISIQDSTIIFKAPFNKKFISDNSPQDQVNPFIWDKILKLYKAPFSTHALKLIVNRATKHYPVVNYCPLITELIARLQPYANVTCWTPTLVRINDRLLVAATNVHLDKAIAHIQLAADVKTLALLSEYGVSIDHSVTKYDSRLVFASNYLSEIDITNLDVAIDWLVELGCDCVYFVGQGSLQLQNKKEMHSKLLAAGIFYRNFKHPYSISRNDLQRADSSIQFKYPVILTFINVSPGDYQHSSAKKIIKVTNSLPIEIK